MFNFSIEVSDKIAKSFEDKLIFSSSLGINNIEVQDNFDSVPLYEMCGEQIEKIRDLLIDHNKRIVLLTTSLKPNEHTKLNLLFRRALVLNVKGIKLIPEKSDNLEYVSKLSKSYGIPLLFENKAKSFLSDEKTMCELVRSVPTSSLIFNPFEFVCTQKHPFFHVYYASKIKNNISFLRINDGLFVENRPVMLHEGCAEVKELASIMLSRSFDGYFSFTPYLPDMTSDNYKKSISIFKDELKNM